MTADRTRTYMAQDARRKQLLEMGLDLFGDRAFDEVSVDDIAKKADISRGLIYHYFGSKRGFYMEVIRYASNRLLSHIQPDRHRSPEENLRAGLQGFFRFARDNAQAYLMVLRGDPGFDDEVRQELNDVRNEIVRRMLVSVPYLESTPLIHTLARGWLSSVETCVQRMLLKKDVGEDELVHYLGASLMSQLAMVLTGEPASADKPWHKALSRALSTLMQPGAQDAVED